MTSVRRRSIGDLLAEHPFFADLDPSLAAQLAGCGRNVHVRPGQHLFRADDPSHEFFLLRRGDVALELAAPGRAPMVVETVGSGSIVGLEWLVPPYRHYLDARVTTPTSAISLDAACLKDACERDHELGYRVMQSVARELCQVIASARIRLLDLYGGPAR